jgi:hypothetical protein
VDGDLSDLPEAGIRNDRDGLLKVLTALHLFRYLGLIALYPALFPVREPGFTEAHLAQITWGDTITGWLALPALIALHLKARLAIPLVWIFNILGFLDFANAGVSMALPLMQDPAAADRSAGCCSPSICRC